MSHLFKSSAAKWGLLVSVIALTLIVVLLSALPSAAQGTIHKVYISNVNDQSFTVSWTTDDPVTSSVNYGTSVAMGSSKADSLNPTTTTMHYVDITGLAATTTYYFETVSGSSHSGPIYSVTTGDALGGSPRGTVTGVVYSSGLPVTNPTIVYIQAWKASVGSSNLASVRTEPGAYVYNLGNLRLADQSDLFSAVAGNTMTVTAQGGSLGTAQVITVTPGVAGTSQVDLNLNGTPNAITLRSLTSRADASVWVPLVGLTLLGTAAIIIVRRRRG
jgi:hypothetical protein